MSNNNYNQNAAQLAAQAAKATQDGGHGAKVKQDQANSK